MLAEIETAVVNLERRGHTLEGFLTHAKEVEKDGKKQIEFPVYHVRFAGKEYWFHTPAEVNAFRAEQAKKLGKELVLADAVTAAPAAPAAPATPGEPVVAPAAPRRPSPRSSATCWTSGTRSAG